MSEFRGELETGARAVLVVMDKRQAMELTGGSALDITPKQAGQLIRELGQGFIAAMSLFHHVRHELRSSRAGCASCAKIARALGDIPYDDFERILADLE